MIDELPEGASGICSAHRWAEDPSCLICYPKEPERGVDESTITDEGEEE